MAASPPPPVLGSNFETSLSQMGAIYAFIAQEAQASLEAQVCVCVFVCVCECVCAMCFVHLWRGVCVSNCLCVCLYVRVCPCVHTHAGSDVVCF